jgi:hypothetical protein
MYGSASLAPSSWMVHRPPNHSTTIPPRSKTKISNQTHKSYNTRLFLFPFFFFIFFIPIQHLRWLSLSTAILPCEIRIESIGKASTRREGDGTGLLELIQVIGTVVWSLMILWCRYPELISVRPSLRPVATEAGSEEAVHSVQLPLPKVIISTIRADRLCGETSLEK